MEINTPTGFLNYHHLRYFWAVAREGSLRRASELLRVSQPSMSAQIGLLEEALGEDLFRPRGRSLELTEFGQMVYGYADEIIALGTELQRAARQAPGARALRLHTGVVDSFPKLMTYDILRPALEHKPAVLVTCHEGKLGELVGQLHSHRLDLVLSDEPASPGTHGRVFNHPLGTTGITFCAMPGLAETLGKRFPRKLDGAPAVLPTQNSALRRDLERWFEDSGVRPNVVGEFEDAALMKIVAGGGAGIVPVPTVVASEAVERYGFVPLGKTKDVEVRFYAITAERRFAHPAIRAITERLRKGK